MKPLMFKNDSEIKMTWNRIRDGNFLYARELLKSKKIGSEVVCSLNLQMALYFNAVYFPFWLLTTLYVLYLKYDSLHNLYQIIVTIVLIILIPMEIFRLYLGYVGNLLEKIPELAGFWMLSMLVQLPLQTFLLVSKGLQPQPTDQAIQLVMWILLIVQICSGLFTVKRIAQHRANNFHLNQIRTNSNANYTYVRNSAYKTD